jgi:CubicO group peptidase (beta-lactamase class C family)
MADDLTETGETPAARLEALFAPFARSDAPGLAVGVMFRGEVMFRRGFGMASLEHGTANTPATRMRIGSTTKHFTALLCLLLAEEGRLDLDAPIRTYVPELAGPAGAPSIRLLLQHRGGSRCHLDLGFIAHGFSLPRAGAALQVLTRQTGRNFAPGEAMIYNNGGYHLTSIALERVGGSSLAAQFKARFFDPLGMDDTFLSPSDHTIAPGMATLHTPAADGTWRRGLFPSEEVLGEGGIVSTVEDMLKWMRRLKRRERFGPPARIGEIFETPAYSRGEAGVYGLGMMMTTYRGARVTHHAGGVIGGVSQMALFPDEDLEIVILCNGAPGADPVALAERVADILLEDRLEPPAETLGTAGHEALLGLWWSHDAAMAYALLDQEGRLKLSIAAGPGPTPLYADGAGRARAAPLAIGDIGLDLEAARTSGRLLVRFGGETQAFERLPGKDAVDQEAFADRVVGAYACPEAGLEARIFLKDGSLRLFTQDPFGSVEGELEALGPRAAMAPAGPGGRPFPLLLTFDEVSRRIRAASGRTRDLVFTPV